MLTFGARVSWAFKCFFLLLFKGRLPDEVLAWAKSAPAGGAPSSQPAADAPAHPTRVDDDPDRAVQTLALLQRDGRLLDFLREDLAAYSDAQIGAAVRDVHAGCRTTLDRYFSVEPILPDAEGQPTSVAAGVDVSTIKLVGNVSGAGPWRGVIRHRGWRISRVELPPLPRDEARQVIAPAEVEVG
jgi:hypothetical protein